MFTGYVHARLDPVVDPTVFVGNFGGGRSWLRPSPQQELIAHLDGYRQAGVRYVLAPVGQALPQSPSTLKLVRRTPTTWIYRLEGAAAYISASGGCAVRTMYAVGASVSCRAPGWSCGERRISRAGRRPSTDAR